MNKVKSSHNHRNQTNISPSSIVTPTVDNTRAVLDSCAGNRVASFKDDVRLYSLFSIELTNPIFSYFSVTDTSAP